MRAKLCIPSLQCVSGGVLVFLPSYSALSRLMERWQTTNQRTRLHAVKPIIVEPRAGGKVCVCASVSLSLSLSLSVCLSLSVFPSVSVSCLCLLSLVHAVIWGLARFLFF